LGIVYALQRKHADAVRELEEARKEDNAGWVIASLGWAHGLAKRPAAARQMLTELDKLEDAGRYVRGDQRAAIHVALGEREEAIKWLRQAYLERSPGLLPILVDPVWDDLREELRFRALIADMDLGGHRAKPGAK